MKEISVIFISSLLSRLISMTIVIFSAQQHESAQLRLALASCIFYTFGRLNHAFLWLTALAASFLEFGLGVKPHFPPPWEQLYLVLLL